MSATRILGAFILQASLFAIPHLFSRRQLPKQPHTFHPCRDKRTVTISCHDNDTNSFGLSHGISGGAAPSAGRHGKQPGETPTESTSTLKQVAHKLFGAEPLQQPENVLF